MAGVLSPRQGSWPANYPREFKSSLFSAVPAPEALAPGLAGRLVVHWVLLNPPAKTRLAGGRAHSFPLGGGRDVGPQAQFPRKCEAGELLARNSLEQTAASTDLPNSGMQVWQPCTPNFRLFFSERHGTGESSQGQR